MIKPKRNNFIFQLFKFHLYFLLKRNFNSIKIEGNFHDTGKPILIIANHVSWWDGFWISYYSIKVLKRKIHFMMLEDQLKKHWYLKYVGAYSIKKNGRGVVESLMCTKELLKDSGNMVFLFPQGEIKSMHNGSIKFKQGIDRIISKSSPDLQVLFIANFIDYFSNQKPNLFMYINKYSNSNLENGSVESTYNEFYNKVLVIQKSKTV